MSPGRGESYLDLQPYLSPLQGSFSVPLYPGLRASRLPGAIGFGTSGAGFWTLAMGKEEFRDGN